jgi:predicted MFS family arabinose efflux permease
VWIPIALLGLVAGVFSESYRVLLLATAVAGGGFAAVYGIGTTVLADTSNPARWYGVKIAAEAFPGALLLFVLPATLAGSHGFAGVVAGMAAMVVLLSLAAVTLPAAGRHDLNALSEEELATQYEALDRRAVWASLVATFAFFSAASGMWAFIERMGAARDFPAESIGNLLAGSLVAATVGSLMTAWLGKRFGNTRPFAFTVGLFLVALYLLGGEPVFAAYALGTAVLTFAIGMGLPFAVAEVARLDADGRFIILSVPAIGFGAMIGPAMAGTLADTGNFAVVLVVAAATIGVSAGAMLVARAIHGY